MTAVPWLGPAMMSLPHLHHNLRIRLRRRINAGKHKQHRQSKQPTSHMKLHLHPHSCFA
jgi:hypothetical protein